ncbi:MAG: hypothetical protein A2506_07865 [Elusimicrobia bacterium RIFOXYD12_FULL_66_9]|nr:MAG: hypothetical protein A2506_07865 [Elusimicrobia bacterium RIFOXYD12_FULL_66_9]
MLPPYFTPRALADLVQPLKVGDLLPGGCRLVNARITDDHARIIYTLSPDIEVVVQAPSPAQASLARTRHLLIRLDARSSAQLSPARRTSLAALIARIGENDTLSPGFLAARAAPPSIRLPGRSTLYLLPGHISDDMDLGLRTLGLLSEIKNIFVEASSIEDLMKPLRRHDIPAKGKRIIPVDQNGGRSGSRVPSALRHLRAGAARREDMCFFGAGEGAPTFCDPGKSIVRAAARLRPAIRIRSVGGPSALTAALMRTEEKIDRFTFLGIAGSLQDLREASQLMRASLRSGLPAVFFIIPTLDPAHLAWLQGSCRAPVERITLHCDLTSPDELVTHHRSWKEAARAYSRLPKGTRIVAVVTPRRGSSI